MPLPPLLLERLKQRGVVLDNVVQKREDDGEDSSCIASSRKRLKPNEAEKASKPRYSPMKRQAEDGEEEEIIAEDYSDESDGSLDKDGTSTNSPKRVEATDNSIGAGDASKQVVHKTALKPFAFSDAPQLQATSSLFAARTAGANDINASFYGCPNKYNIYHECSKYCRDRYMDVEVEPSLEQRKQLALILRSYPMTSEWRPCYDPGIGTFYFWNIMTNMVSWLPYGHHKARISFPADHLRASCVLFKH